VVYGYDVETKMQSSQWMVKVSPRLKNTDDSGKDQVVNGCVFRLERHCPS